MHKRLGFTLIELLIVVAIIAILAAIAVPNFLESQVRAKVSRSKADMRTIAVALESYAVDHNKYPSEFHCDYLVQRMFVLSTPVAYIASLDLADPFTPTGAIYYGTSGRTVAVGDSYTYVCYYDHWQRSYYPTLKRQGSVVHGYGPSRWRSDLEHYPGVYHFQDIAYGWRTMDGAQVEKPQFINILYDPSNGTRSYGGVGRVVGDLGCPPVIGGGSN